MKPKSDKSQGCKNILQIIIPYFLIVGTFQLIGAFTCGLNLEDYKNATTQQHFILSLFGLIGTLLVIWIFRVYVDKKTFLSLGFHRLFLKKEVLLGLILGFLIMLAGFVSLLLSRQIELLYIRFNFLDFVLSCILFVFVAISEEIIMRGYILSNLMDSFNKYIALAISAFIFSLMHAFNEHYNLVSMLSLFVSGVLFGLPYIYTKRLWFPIALHFGWNFFQGTIFGFNVSGRDTYSLIRTKEDISNIWNGGRFGFEGSILSILFQLFVLVILFSIFKDNAHENQYAPESGSRKTMDMS